VGMEKAKQMEIICLISSGFTAAVKRYSRLYLRGRSSLPYETEVNVTLTTLPIVIGAKSLSRSVSTRSS
jgi:hypothetical protein